MDYQLENLGEDRFQEVCQALIAKEFPNVQAFPIKQPDGGRDAIAYLHSSRLSSRKDPSFVVFQVKYVRKPLAEPEPHKWLLDILEKEAPKLSALIPKGAMGYYLLTNVPGTAHLETGSIDKADGILRSALHSLGIEPYVWWRDDLNRRLDNSYDLKWRYPEIMGATDLLRGIIENGLTEDKERRASAIKTFLRKQYDDDEDVRFKQIELQNKLLDLFVDVPLATQYPSHGALTDRTESSTVRMISLLCGLANSPVGAATAFLNRNVQKDFPKLVLEGAPGQGKSTLAQYICQVHRMRLLNETDAISRLPREHQTDSLRIPLRVDLRDLATWFSKQDPFTPEEKKDIPDQWAPSLEAFLAAQIHFHSGGVAFSVSDLHAVTKLSSILLVLDGLDEVADLTQRQEVVKQMISGVSRLREIAPSLQVLITSRPTAFTSSIGFPEREFPHLQLDSLTPPLVLSYAEKWNKTQKLTHRDAANVIRIMKQKIEQPHLRDLARNPMQLSILLSLIHTHGPSLPDKRTALYDGYVALFLKRESEKDEVVRDNRDLLIDLHRYLGWYLHSQSEREASKSRIGHDDLQSLLKAYLISEERKDDSVTDLFTAMKERIIFIVSRIQGTFEFEVQPLREYFAARHLYVTAPYAPSGSARKGTLPDRFDGIAPSPYWLNVTRFFAGCFDKGELPCLVDRLRYLSERPDYRFTNHPQRLAAVLLGDWVFSEDQRSTRTTVELLLSGIGLRHPLAGGRAFRTALEPFVLPSRCGREELVSKCFEIIRSETNSDYAEEIMRLVVANATNDEIDNFWGGEVQKCSDANFTNWLRNGQHLGTLGRSDLTLLEELFAGKQLTADLANIFLQAGRVDFLIESEERTEITIGGILGEKIKGRRQSTDPLSVLSHELDVYKYSLVFRQAYPGSLQDLVRHVYAYTLETPRKLSPVQNGSPSLQKCVEFVDLSNTQSQISALEWAAALGPWSTLIEKSRSLWGDQWATYRLANVAAGITSSAITCREFPDLLDCEKPLCERVRYARLRAGNPKWWKAQFELATNSMDKMLVALVFLSWTSISTIAKISDAASVFLDHLSTDEWQTVFDGIRWDYWFPSKRTLGRSLKDFPDTMSDRLVVGLGNALGRLDCATLYDQYLSDYSGDDFTILRFCAETSLRMALSDAKFWNQSLPLVKKLYRKRVMVNTPMMDKYFYAFQRRPTESLPIKVAIQIAQESRKYPRSLLLYASDRCQTEAEEHLTAVADIASREKWFERA